MDRFVEVELSRIIINDNADQQFIFLREKEGVREFPIVIAFMEAMAIDRFINAKQTQRPLTHELLHSVLQGLEARVIRVEVTKLENSTFFANLVVRHPGGEIALDARPSDAIAIGVRDHAPIYVHEDVLEEVAAQ
jgi:bifunctional DNase/RNase